jgi:hypothetical protein
MLCGCVMIVFGLIYAFYVKPIVIRQMKAAALARAKAPGRVKGDVEMARAGTVVI